MIGNIIIGIIFGGIGFWFVKEAYYINHQVLFVGWAERKWGPGSGVTFYRFFGIGLMIFGFFTMIGRIDVFGAATGTTNPQPNNGGVQNGFSASLIPQQTRPVIQNGRIAP
jgi:hypothetical protein